MVKERHGYNEVGNILDQEKNNMVIRLSCKLFFNAKTDQISNGKSIKIQPWLQ